MAKEVRSVFAMLGYITETPTIALPQELPKNWEDDIRVRNALRSSEIHLHRAACDAGMNAGGDVGHKADDHVNKSHLTTFKRPPSAGSGPPVSKVTFQPVWSAIRSRMGWRNLGRHSMTLKHGCYVRD